MEEMYEVLKFIEHGTTCRRSLDCVQGVSLIRRMKTHPGMDRRGLLVWFREIARCVDQYHRSGSGQDYRYLNPYSIIVTEEDGLRLLDLEAPDNASVIKQMQKRISLLMERLFSSCWPIRKSGRLSPDWKR